MHKTENGEMIRFTKKILDGGRMTKMCQEREKRADPECGKAWAGNQNVQDSNTGLTMWTYRWRILGH